jgi:hypothetical protein
MSEVKKESVEEFLARGGRIKRVEPIVGDKLLVTGGHCGYTNLLRVLETPKSDTTESEGAKSKRLDKEVEDKYEKIHQERDRRYSEKNA